MIYAQARCDRGLQGLSQDCGERERQLQMSVFDGLTANRRSCAVCGYTEAVMHFPLDNWPLAIPSHVVCIRYPALHFD